MKNLYLPVKAKWFEMTKTGIKTEDYREITPYWFKRLFDYYDPETLMSGDIYEAIIEMQDGKCTIQELKDWAGFEPKRFDYNILTLGYPKSTDTDRILKLEHKGIEIRTGKPEWGAEPGKLYFVILHGNTLQL